MVCLSVLFNGCDFLKPEHVESGCPLLCDQSKPTTGDLIIRATINSKNTHVPIAVFRGDFDAKDLLLYDTLSGPEMVYHNFPVDHHFSVVAEYVQSDGDTVITIDGTAVRAVSYDCEDNVSCYDGAYGRIDVRLLFPKRSISKR